MTLQGHHPLQYSQDWTQCEQMSHNRTAGPEQSPSHPSSKQHRATLSERQPLTVVSFYLGPEMATSSDTVLDFPDSSSGTPWTSWLPHPSARHLQGMALEQQGPPTAFTALRPYYSNRPLGLFSPLLICHDTHVLSSPQEPGTSLHTLLLNKTPISDWSKQFRI